MASVLAIDDGDAADAHLAQHDLAADAFLTGDQAGHRVADYGGLDLPLLESRGRKRIVNRVTCEDSSCSCSDTCRTSPYPRR